MRVASHHPRREPVDIEPGLFVQLISDDQVFLDACACDAATSGGEVSVSRVRALLTDNDGVLRIEPRRLARLWQMHTGVGKAMVYTSGVEECQGSKSGNDHKLFRRRLWVGGDL
jgi:hypothetical protein